MKKRRRDLQVINNMDEMMQMSKDEIFRYNYSAKDSREVQEIRKKYLPQEESKLEELKRLDKRVQDSGMVESLIVGIVGMLIFGLGMCLAMEVIGNSMILGVLIGIVGAIGMFAAYPVYRSVFEKAKAKYAPRILELTEELSDEKINRIDVAQGNK